MIQIHKCYTKEAFFGLARSEIFLQRQRLEFYIAAHHNDHEHYYLPGYCLVHDHPTLFLVDHQFGSVTEENGVRIPNWRERLVCPDCQLNNRERAIVGFVTEQCRRRHAKLGAVSLFLSDKASTVAYAISSRFSQFGISGEDSPARLASESIDFVLCNETLNLCSDPFKTLQQYAKALRPDGQLFLTVPFDTSRMKTTQRARMRDGEQDLLQPAQYSISQLHPQGALIYSDFGWDLLSMMREAGFSECAMHAYWSYEFGYLGGVQYYLHGLK